MYVGRELLTDELTGFNHGVGQHQGVVAKKSAIQQGFLRKAEAAAARTQPALEQG
jgi:hypothetical protein